MSMKKGGNDYFESICEVVRAFGTTLNKDEILELIVDNAIKTMNGKAACLFLAEEGEEVYQPVAQKGLSENYLHADPMKAKKAAKDVFEGGYLAIRDASSDPRVENHDAKKEEGIASILVVPALFKGKTVGILALYTDKPVDFSPEEIEFLKALAEQGAIAIEHARLFEQLRENTRIFLDIAASIHSSLDIRKILHILSADVADALGVKASSIRLLNEDTQLLELVSSYGLSEGYLDKGPVRADKSISDTLKGKPVWIEDATTDDRVQYHDEKKKEGIVSILSVPIKTKERVIGELRLYTDRKREFTEDEIMLVNALAYLGGLAIQNASLYLMLKTDMKELQEDIWSHRSWF